MVTFRLSVPLFVKLLQVVLKPDAPDDLANRVLMACTRPRGGIISVPLGTDDALAIVNLAEHAGPEFEELATLLRDQTGSD